MSTTATTNRPSLFWETQVKVKNFLSSHDFQDKLMKFVQKCLCLISDIAKRMEASGRTMHNLGQAENAVGIVRDVTGLLNGVRGILVVMKDTGVQSVKIIKSFWNGKNRVDLRTDHGKKACAPKPVIAVSNNERFEISWNSNIELPPGSTLEKSPKHNDIAVGPWEKLAKLGENAFSMLAGFSFFAAFTVPRPISVVDKIFDVELSSMAKRIKGMFSPIMMVNHICAVAQNLFGLLYEGLAYNRALYADRIDKDIVYKDCGLEIITKIMGVVEKSLESGEDVCRLLDKGLPWLAVVSSGIGLLRQGIKEFNKGNS